MANKAILIGRVGRDCELKYHNGTAYGNFSIATSESWKKDGEKQTRTDWHNCTMRGKPAESLSQYIIKGSMIYCEGKIQYREWEDKDGNKRKNTDIIVDKVEFLGGGQRREGVSDQRHDDQPAHDQQSDQSPVADEDLPF